MAAKFKVLVSAGLRRAWPEPGGRRPEATHPEEGEPARFVPHPCLDVAGGEGDVLRRHPARGRLPGGHDRRRLRAPRGFPKTRHHGVASGPPRDPRERSSLRSHPSLFFPGPVPPAHPGILSRARALSRVSANAFGRASALPPRGSARAPGHGFVPRHVPASVSLDDALVSRGRNSAPPRETRRPRPLRRVERTWPCRHRRGARPQRPARRRAAPDHAPPPLLPPP